MIDLHLHTTASDGRCAPREIASVARRAGLAVFSVTDHDTVAGLAEAGRGAAVEGVRLIPGIEITAVQQDADVHVLGYFIDPAAPRFAAFLASQRADRARRLREMGAKLAGLGMPIDVDRLLEAAGGEASGRAVGRPALARALVDAGHVAEPAARLRSLPRRGTAGVGAASRAFARRGGGGRPRRRRPRVARAPGAARP